MRNITHDEWLTQLHVLEKSKACTEHAAQIRIVVATQLWRAKTVTTVASTPKGLAVQHAEDVLHDIRRGIANGSLIGVTTTKFGATYWGVQKSIKQEEL